MGPPSRSLAAEALGCFLVRITGGSNRIQDRGAMIAPDGGLPSDCQCKNLRPRDGARTRTGDLKTSLTLQSPYKGRVPGLPASGRARLSPPGRDCLLGEPDRQTAALTQAGVIGGPVRDLAPLPGNVVAAVLVQLERQGGHPRSDEGRRPTPPRPQHQPPSRSMQHSPVRTRALRRTSAVTTGLRPPLRPRAAAA